MNSLDTVLRRALAVLGPPKQRALLDEIALWSCGAVMVVLALAWWSVISKSQGAELWWDLRVYQGASDAIAAGRDPYNADVMRELSRTGMAYVVPPAPAALIRLWSLSPLQPLFAPLLKVGCVVAYFYTIVALLRLFFDDLRPSRLFFTFGATLTAFNCAGFSALVMGNMGTIFHGLIIWGAVRGLTQKKWALFHVMVVIASAFKPFYPVYWIIPALAHGWSWRQIGWGALGVVAVGAIYALGALLDPAAQTMWIHNLTFISLGADKHNGMGVFSAASLILAPPWPYLLQFAFMGAIAALLAFKPIADEKARWAALIFSAIMLNPRVSLSDLPVAVLPMLFLVVRLLPEAFTLPERLCIAAVLTFLIGMAHDIASPVASWYYVLMLIVPLALTVWAEGGAEKRPSPVS